MRQVQQGGYGGGWGEDEVLRQVQERLLLLQGVPTTPLEGAQEAVSDKVGRAFHQYCGLRDALYKHLCDDV